MSVAVLGFQLFIIMSILITRVFAVDKVLFLCVSWTFFTLVMVFASPLILLQLVVIWTTYNLVTKKKTGDVPEAAP
jgi:hypothetical protein